MPRPPSFDDRKIHKLLKENIIADMDKLKSALGTTGTMTVYRALSRLGYRSSYSHRGKFYTLEEIADFDSHGLWSYRDVWFSCYGNLVETAKELVERSRAGFTTEELESVVGVDPKQALLKLYRAEQLHRQKIDALYVYFATEKPVRKRQLLTRRQHDEREREGEIGKLCDEFKAALILFYSLLDEKQRRLFAGLESQRLGHGGDTRVAEVLGLDMHTVAKGRRELFSNEVDTGRSPLTGARLTADPARVLFHALGAWRIKPGFHDMLWNPAFTVPAAQFGAGPAGIPFHVLGLVPAGLAMLVAAALRWERADDLVH
jgi:hypothetical protein